MSASHHDDPHGADRDELAGLLVQMGGLVERQIAQAVQALLLRDLQAGQDTVARDRQVDEMQARIDAFAVRCLTDRANPANRVHAILLFLKATAALERIGDYAANIAKRATRLDVLPDMPFSGALRSMSRLVQDNLRQAIDALEAGDAAQAARVWHGDKAVDDVHTTLSTEVLASMADRRAEVAALAHVLFIARNLERMGDHVTTIAECVYATATGETLSGVRPKGAGSAAT